MTLRLLALTLPFLATGPVMAEGLDGVRVDLSFSALAAGDGSVLRSGALTLDGGLSFGAYGLQISTEAQALDGVTDLDVAALRLILHRRFGEHLRLGLSVGTTAGDDPTDGFMSLGLHARYDAPGYRAGGDLIKPPDDRGSDGAFVTTAWAEQDLRPDLTLRGELYRRSTDTEDQDLAAALIGLEHDFGSDLSGFAHIFTVNADDHAFYNQGVQLGLGWQWAAGREIYGAADVKTGTGVDAFGVTIGLRLALGNGALLFESGPLPELVGYGAY